MAINVPIRSKIGSLVQCLPYRGHDLVDPVNYLLALFPSFTQLVIPALRRNTTQLTSGTE